MRRPQRPTPTWPPRRRLLPLCLLAAWLATACGAAAPAPAPPPDPRVVALLDAMLDALAQPDEAARARALVPLVHRSLLTEDGADLTDTVKRYALAKAAANVGVVVRPPVVVEVRDDGPTREGFGAAFERGRRERYFLQKRPGVAGLPTPIAVFWPEAGGPPRVLNFGGL